MSVNHSSKTISLILALAVLVCDGCSKYSQEENKETVPADFDSYLTDASNLLFANLDAYAQGGSPTKSGVANYVPLSSLVDFDHESVLKEGNVSISEFPFFSNSENNYYCHLSEKQEPGSRVCKDSVMLLRKFLVTLSDAESEIQGVVTMLADYSYFAKYGMESISFINKPYFTGIIIFSQLDGTYDSVFRYYDGLVVSGDLLRSGEDVSQTGTPTYLCRVDVENTKVYGGMLDGAVCIGEKMPQFLEYNNRNDSYGRGTVMVEDTENKTMHPLGGGGKFNFGTTYTIKISTATPPMGQNLHVKGAGTYTRGVTICIEVFPRDQFGYWTGDFKGKKEIFCIVVDRNYSATVYSKSPNGDKQQPCIDLANNIANMLINMDIAGSGKWNNIKGGTYGKGVRTRVLPDGSKKPRDHWGYDFAAEIGTPIYAQYDGTIGDVVTGCPSTNEGADGETFNKGYGNTIWVETRLGNDNLKFMYAHLDYDDPVAINPRTNKPFEEGDEVFRGDIIGYSGKSGNAWNDKEVPNKHVHWEVWKNGNRIDGKDYINGTVFLQNGSIINIKCDK